MNITHKCLFHSGSQIVKFCQQKLCTLPLCHDCEPIHLTEHQSQHTQPKVVRFNQALLRASNQMEDFLHAQRIFERDQLSKIDIDRNAAIAILDQYYDLARNTLKDLQKNAERVQQNLNKLKKGSIKALIFYYSGDISLDKLDFEFEPLQKKIYNLLQRAEEDENQERIEKNEKNSRVPKEEINRPAERIEYQANAEKILKGKDTETDNLFANIQETNIDKSRQRNRRSIFDKEAKKNSVILQNQNISTNETYTKYKKPEQYLKQEPKNSYIQPSNKYSYDISNKYSQINQRQQIQKEDTAYQNRFTHRITIPEPVQHNQNPSSPFRNQFIEPKYQYEYNPTNNAYNNRILRPSDLEINKDNNIYKQKTIQTTSLISQKNRSWSQNHLSKVKEIPKQTNEIDLKKQVLSPDEIRKMLERKIEERNRILSIKKSENYQPQYEQKPKKSWETRDSIINQIYNQNKY